MSYVSLKPVLEINTRVVLMCVRLMLSVKGQKCFLLTQMPALIVMPVLPHALNRQYIQKVQYLLINKTLSRLMPKIPLIYPVIRESIDPIDSNTPKRKSDFIGRFAVVGGLVLQAFILQKRYSNKCQKQQ